MLLYTLVACSICLLFGTRGAGGTDPSKGCFLNNTSNYVQVTTAQGVQTVNLTPSRGDIIEHLCSLCNCTSSQPCSCSYVSPDLTWVTTHPLQHLLLLITLLLPNQFHLRRPRTARVSSAA
uniref:GP3 protein n=1 Tax=Mikumi yellow baboon virus 1 TaxID=1546177 RepID=A0A089G216_9NIDO|nr:GP3 protein [Mikumi yellow baboon virus 1]